MAIDGFFIKNLISELKNDILNNRLEKITQTSSDIFSFSLYYQRSRKFLNFKLKPPYASFFITNETVNDESSNSSFLNTLKRNIEGYILTNITQHLNDRVVTFEFSGVDIIKGRLNKQLIVELMGRYNNLILVEDGIVVDAFIKNVSTTSRSIVSKAVYEFFPSEKETFTLESYNKLESPNYLSKTYLGISPLLSNYLYNNPIDIFQVSIVPTKNLSNNQFYWFDLFENEVNKIHFDSLSDLLSNNIKTKDISKEKYDNFIRKSIQLYETRILKLNERLKSYQEDTKLRDYGNYIYSSGLNLNETHSEIITYDNQVISLDINNTLKENAQIFYKKYEKAKRAILHIDEQIIDNENHLNLFNEFLYELNTTSSDFKALELALKPFGFKTKQKPSKKKEIKLNYLKLEYLNNIYYIGRNSQENIIVTHELSNKNDYWFHIKDAPGSHVLMKGEISDAALEFGAMLAAMYSKEKNTPVISINYTQIKYLKKIPKMPLSQVILTRHQTINIKIDFDLINSVFVANKLK